MNWIVWDLDQNSFVKVYLFLSGQLHGLCISFIIDLPYLDDTELLPYHLCLPFLSVQYAITYPTVSIMQ